MAPLAAVQLLSRRLSEASAAATAVYLPHTDHVFDIIGTALSPVARVGIHALERFLALVSIAEPALPAQSGTPGI